MSDYQLGQRVKISGTALKQKSGDKTFYVDADKPFRVSYPSNKTFDSGVIVGSRTVIDGYRDHDNDSGYYFCPIAGTSRRVWIVSFDLRMKPTMCFDHQIAAVEAGPTVTVPAPHVPYPGPHDTDATFMRGAAKRIKNDHPVGGYNVTTAVIKLLNDTADAMETP